MPMQAQRGGGGIAPTHSQPGTRRSWVISTVPWPLNPQDSPSTHCTGVWVGTSLDGMENLTTLGFDPQISQPIASGCNYCGIWAA
jgi:hypothetical protein